MLDNGKFLVVGHTDTGSGIDSMLMRYNADGTLDTSFGVGGVVTSDVGNEINWTRDLVVQPDRMVRVVHLNPLAL